MPLPQTEMPGRLQAHFAERGIRMTQQRRAILRVMEMATKHLDAANLLRKAQKLDASATCGHAATRCRRVLLESLGWYGTYFYESEMALISE